MESISCTRDEQKFYVEIKSTEHQTWQGSITWLEGNKKEYFRSTMELLKLMQSTIAD